MQMPNTYFFRVDVKQVVKVHNLDISIEFILDSVPFISAEESVCDQHKSAYQNNNQLSFRQTAHENALSNGISLCL